jgi:hypothetical protein
MKVDLIADLIPERVNKDELSEIGTTVLGSLLLMLGESLCLY